MLDKIKLLLKVYLGNKFNFEDSDIEELIEFTKQYRPSCLDANEQDEAQSYYVIYLLLTRYYAENSHNGIDLNNIKSMSIGDESVTLSDNAENTPLKPSYWHEKWQELWDICNNGIGHIVISRAYHGKCCR